MKKLISLSTLSVVLLFSSETYAKIWRVNNTAGVNADYNNAQTAVSAVTTLSGDTIHIEPSVTSYGNLTVAKSLVIIGNGYFLTLNTGLQANTNNSTFNYIVLDGGSNNSSVQGINTGGLYIYSPNVLIRRCNIQAGYIYMYTTATNCTILDNFMYGVSEQSGPLTGFTISNNIIYFGAVSLGANSTGTFENNTCAGGGVTLYNFQVNNNIFNTTGFTPNNCVYFNNIGNSTQFGNANGNQQNVVMSTVFVASGTTDGQYQLGAGSPAIGAGFNGVDCGAYGGPNPYKLSGIPNVPTIYSLTVPPTGTTNINVTISTKSNN